MPKQPQESATGLRQSSRGSTQSCSRFLRLFGYAALLLTVSCYRAPKEELVLIQIQDRNGLSETISDEEKLAVHGTKDFLASQPYKKVLRLYRLEGKNRSVITTYHPNGSLWQLLEAKEMRAFGAYREWFSDGTQKIEAAVIGGTADLTPSAQETWLFDGVSEVWNEKGALLAQIAYDKGVLSGISAFYYPSGALEKEAPYMQDLLEGEEKTFWESGERKSIARYRAGCKEGKSVGFWPDGAPSSEEEYEGGYLLEGRYFDAAQNLVAEVKNRAGQRALFDQRRPVRIEEIRNGLAEGLVQCFDASGHLHSTYHLKNGKKQGEEIEYFPQSAQAKLSLDWDQDAIHGIVKTWYEHGQMESQREIYKNKKAGIACAWYRNGNLMLLEEYENDLLQRGQYFKKNQSTPVSTISTGNGIATLYDSDGLFQSKVVYLKGKPVDE